MGDSQSALAGHLVVERLGSQVGPGEAFNSFSSLPFCFFLDSALVEGRLGRFSFLGARPRIFVSSKGRSVRWFEAGVERRLRRNPFALLRSLINSHGIERREHPVPFVGGLVGYLGYDLCHFVERLPRTARDDIRLPDMCFGGVAEVEALLAAARPADGEEWLPASVGPIVGNFTRERYLAAVRRAKDYIAAGDIFQVNLSQRFSTRLAVGPAELYRRLRRANPAPFAAYLSLDHVGGAVLSSSPERFLKVVDGHVETRPIKGTRPRGRTPEEDQRQAAELRASVKDAAELTMIVDLERNDLGRVCDYGSVVVTEHKALETYASVFHLVSTVEGKLHQGRDLVDLLKATFPGGSITGAPKIRAMEIIDELEPTQRSVYTGSIGYIGLDGTCDLNIAIRTILVRGSRAFFQVGGGIVADSDPEAEYRETLDKGRRLFAALGHRCEDDDAAL